MQIFPSRNQFKNSASEALLKTLETHEELLDLEDALLYNSFPLYKDDEGNVIMADCLLLSPHYGVVTFAVVDLRGLSSGEEQRCREVTEQVPPYVQSRLIKN